MNLSACLFFLLYFISFIHLFFNFYSVSNLKTFTDLQETGSGMRENNSVCQEHPSFCFSIIQLSLTTLACYIYCHWTVRSLVSDWTFPESGYIFAHWECGLIPLNKIGSRKTFLNKFKQAKKEKKKNFIDLYLTVWIVRSH